MHKIGDKVETPLGIGVIQSLEETIFVDEKDNPIYDYAVKFENDYDYYTEHKLDKIIFLNHVVKPYHTAHEKLIEMVWECVDNDKKYAVYRKTTLKNEYHNDYIQLEVIKRTKTFGAIRYYNDNFNSQYSHHQFNFDLTLSRILTQYLEEMKQ